MEIKTVWAVYFSGTGTTQKVATTLAKSVAQSLGAGYEEYCFNLPAAREKELTFTPEDLVVLGVPVYAGRVPNLLLPYVRDSIHGGGALAVPVVLYGNRNFDDGLMELRNVARDNGFHPIAAGAFVGEHSFSTVLGAGRPAHGARRRHARRGARLRGAAGPLHARHAAGQLPGRLRRRPDRPAVAAGRGQGRGVPRRRGRPLQLAESRRGRRERKD